MKRIKRWLMLKLIEILGIDSLSDNLYNLKTSYDNQLNCMNIKINQHYNDIYTLNKTIKNIVSIGTDINLQPTNNSWSVICIEGKINIVKFIDLNNNDARHILEYLKQFELGRHCIDTPNKYMFEELYKINE